MQSDAEYTPNKVVKGLDTIRVDVTYNTEETQSFTVAIYPATTVYYEEDFSKLNGFTDGSKGTGTQATEVADQNDVKKINNYGYDPAYATNAMSENAPSSESGGVVTFTFTGDGVDIYTKSTNDSGTYMISMQATRPPGLPKEPSMTGLFPFCLILDTREQRTPTVPGTTPISQRRMFTSARREKNSDIPPPTRTESAVTAARQRIAGTALTKRNVEQMRKGRSS